MGLKHLAAGVVVACAAVGCSNAPKQSPDVQHWVSQVPPGTSAEDARQILGRDGFKTWTDGRIICAIRDPDWPVPESNGTTAAIHLGSDGRVAWAEFFNSPGHDYPMLAPAYPSP
ncbi:MAG TPA: hypothetical protein VLJ39_02505 [Tepidisphaeraceae bacterium]|nr:hypothetical protein [Tepidisphaeraceae bacterium]